MRAPPFRLSGGLLLLQGVEVRVGLPTSGLPLGSCCPGYSLDSRGQQVRSCPDAALVVRLELGSEQGAPDGCGRGRARLCRSSLWFPVCRHVPCGRGAAPGGSRIGGTGRCSCVVDGGAGPREPCILAGGWGTLSPTTSRPGGAAAGPRGPAAAASLASMHQCVVKALDARPLSPCCRPGETVTWHMGRA